MGGDESAGADISGGGGVGGRRRGRAEGGTGVGVQNVRIEKLINIVALPFLRVNYFYMIYIHAISQ